MRNKHNGNSRGGEQRLRRHSIKKFKGAQPSVRFSTHFFVIPINTIWISDLRTGEFFLFFSKTTADIRYFVFFAHAERASLKKGLRRLSLR